MHLYIFICVSIDCDILSEDGEVSLSSSRGGKSAKPHTPMTAVTASSASSETLQKFNEAAAAAKVVNLGFGGQIDSRVSAAPSSPPPTAGMVSQDPLDTPEAVRARDLFRLLLHSSQMASHWMADRERV